MRNYDTKIAIGDIALAYSDFKKQATGFRSLLAHPAMYGVKLDLTPAEQCARIAVLNALEVEFARFEKLVDTLAKDHAV
jgi:hypothetical protein